MVKHSQRRQQLVRLNHQADDGAMPQAKIFGGQWVRKGWLRHFARAAVSNTQPRLHSDHGRVLENKELRSLTGS